MGKGASWTGSPSGSTRSPVSPWESARCDAVPGEQPLPARPAEVLGFRPGLPQGLVFCLEPLVVLPQRIVTDSTGLCPRDGVDHALGFCQLVEAETLMERTDSLSCPLLSLKQPTPCP